MDKVTSLKRATQRSFGYQWTHFVDMVDANREHFLTYIFPIEPAFFEFRVSYADWFDRLAASIGFCKREQGVDELMHSAGPSNIGITATGLYGWRVPRIKR